VKTFRVRCKQVGWFDEWVEAEDAEEARHKSECGYGTDQEYDDYSEVEIIAVEEEEAHA